MTPDELRVTLERLGLSQTRAARLCGVDARTIRRWYAGKTAIPGPVERLLWCMERDRELIELLYEWGK